VIRCRSGEDVAVLRSTGSVHFWVVIVVLAN
jgi:hypothetical protein